MCWRRGKKNFQFLAGGSRHKAYEGDLGMARQMLGAEGSLLVGEAKGAFVCCSEKSKSERDRLGIAWNKSRRVEAGNREEGESESRAEQKLAAVGQIGTG